MADVKWIKITTDIFDDEKILLIETLPEADSLIVIWFKLLCLAGKQNNHGVFLMNDRIPYTDKMLATIFRRPESVVQLALTTFEQFGMIERVEGVITIPNWSKHQSLDQLEAKKEYMKNYMREYRERQKLQIEGSKSYGKYNNKTNVSEADKIREDKNRLEEDKKRNKDASADEVGKMIEEFSSGDSSLVDSLWAFYEMRKKIKKPLNPYAMKLILNKLREFSDDAAVQVQILNESIVNNWQSVYPLKERKAEPMPKGYAPQPTLGPDEQRSLEWMKQFRAKKEAEQRDNQ